MQKGLSFVELEIFRLGEGMTVASELERRRLDIPTEEDVLRFALAHYPKVIREMTKRTDFQDPIAFFHIDNQWKGNRREMSTLCLEYSNFGFDRILSLRPGQPDKEDNQIWKFAGRRLPGVERPNSERDWLCV
jgi:hypothetical protein